MNHREDTSHEWLPNDIRPDPAGRHTTVAIPADTARTIIATLNLFHQFFRHHASTAVHAELRAFSALQGWHPACGAEALLDDLGWHTLPLQRALDASTEPGDQATTSAS